MNFVRTCAFGALATVTLATAAQAVVVPITQGSAIGVSRDRTTGDSALNTDFPAAEGPNQAIDSNTATKYLNFTGAGLDDNGTPNANPTGLIFTLTAPSAIDAFQFTTANDFASRDPGMVIIEGTNALPSGSLPGTAFTQVYSGPTGITNTTPRFTAAPAISFPTSGVFSSYRVTITDLVRFDGSSPTNSQFSEIALQLNGTVPEPASLGLLGLGGLTLLRRRRA